MCDETTRGEAQGEITRVLCSGATEGRRGDRGASRDGRAGGCCRVYQVHTLEPLSAAKVGEGWLQTGTCGLVWCSMAVAGHYGIKM